MKCKICGYETEIPPEGHYSIAELVGHLIIDHNYDLKNDYVKELLDLSKVR